MRIVVADDAVVLRALLRRLLTEGGHAVVGEAVDATAALAAIEELLPDALVLDGRLPPAGAIALLEQLRGRPARPKTFVIAALHETELVRAAVAAGAAGVVLRPIVATQIADVLRSRP